MTNDITVKVFESKTRGIYTRVRHIGRMPLSIAMDAIDEIREMRERAGLQAEYFMEFDVQL